MSNVPSVVVVKIVYCVEYESVSFVYKILKLLQIDNGANCKDMNEGRKFSEDPTPAAF